MFSSFCRLDVNFIIRKWKLMNVYSRKICIHFTFCIVSGNYWEDVVFLQSIPCLIMNCFSFFRYIYSAYITNCSEIRLCCLYSIDLDGSIRLFISWRDNTITSIRQHQNILLWIQQKHLLRKERILTGINNLKVTCNEDLCSWKGWTL